jgi:hypothetical protein
MVAYLFAPLCCLSAPERQFQVEKFPPRNNPGGISKPGGKFLGGNKTHPEKFIQVEII